MPWSGVNSSQAINVAYCRTKCNKIAVIYDNYYFHHNRNYKDGDYWCCAQRGCRVRLISSKMNPNSDQMIFARRNPSIKHGHNPNAPNLVDKEFRRTVLTKIEQSNKAGGLTAASMRAIYDETRREAIRSGIPQSLIPAFWNIRSSMYRIKRKQQVDETFSNKTAQTKDALTDHSNDEVLSVGSSSPSPSYTLSDQYSVGLATNDNMEQTEPLCLVTEKYPPREEKYSSPILLQTLCSPVLSANANTTIAPAVVDEPSHVNVPVMTYPTNDTFLYSKHYQPNSYFPTYPADMFQHYAAFHAEYLRSLIALNLYPRF